MKSRAPDLDELDLEKLAEILSMKKGPAAEARYLIDLYQDEALSIAEDCHFIFLDSGCSSAAAYWRGVCDHIKPLMTKH